MTGDHVLTIAQLPRAYWPHPRQYPIRLTLTREQMIDEAVRRVLAKPFPRAYRVACGVQFDDGERPCIHPLLAEYVRAEFNRIAREQAA